jgi:hypothetical protein
LTPRHRDAIRRLSHDVPGLWQAPLTTAKDRQEIVRLLLERVTVDVQGESEQVAVTLQWAGGCKSAHRMIRPVGRYAQLSTYPVLLARIDALREAGHSFAQIAMELNRDGFAPPKRTQRFTGGMVVRLLGHRGLQGSRPQSMVASSVLQVHESWLTDLARRLTMPCATLYKWQRLGWVHSRKVEVAGGRWAIWADDDELERLRQLRTHQRKWPEPGYPAALTRPKAREPE